MLLMDLLYANREFLFLLFQIYVSLFLLCIKLYSCTHSPEGELTKFLILFQLDYQVENKVL